MLMEERQQLDLHRPLLSTRRPPSTQPLEPEKAASSRDSAPDVFAPPVYKSETRSGPVRNPGTVPFQWEHKPGKPKDESCSETKQQFVPKLPPGRTLNTRDREPRRRAESKVSVRTKTGNVSAYQIPIAEDTKSYRSVYEDENARSEPFFLNCSVSGVSGSDGPDMNPSGTFSSDPQTRDFTMVRFLPAAKAMAAEAPQHLPRKPPLSPKEQQRQIEKAIPVMKRPSLRMQAQRAVSVRSLRSNDPNSTHYHENDNKHANGARQEQRSTRICQKTEMQEDKIKSSTQPSQSARETQKPNGSVLQGCPQGEAPLSASFVSERQEKSENLHASSRSKTGKNFGELLANDDNRWEEPCPEKTLHVDTEHTGKSPDGKTQAKSKNPSPDETPAQELGECRSLKANGDQRARPEDELPNKKCMERRVEEKNDPEGSDGRQHLLSLPLPLPKAPSDSWLKRTLTAMPSKNSSGVDTFAKTRAHPKAGNNGKKHPTHCQDLRRHSTLCLRHSQSRNPTFSPKRRC